MNNESRIQLWGSLSELREQLYDQLGDQLRIQFASELRRQLAQQLWDQLQVQLRRYDGQ